jgi:hypothetical protein
MLKSDANAAIIAAGLVVGNITTAYSETVAYRKVISQNPTDGGKHVVCGTPVAMVISEGSTCYIGMSNYSQWNIVGRPRCWCYYRQCHGDADGKTPQTKAPYYYVTNDDLAILKSGWNKTVEQMSGTNGICADFNRKSPQTKAPYYRVTNDDLAILKANWNKSGPDPNCDPGNRTP